MARHFTPAAEAWRYTLLADRALAVDYQTVFVLSPISQAEMAVTEDAIVRTSVDNEGRPNVVSRHRQTTRELALEHIVSIENFPVGSPKPWPEGRKARDAYLAQFHLEDVHEVGNEIFTHSKLGAEAPAAKNSSMPGPTSSSGDTSGATAAPATG